MRVLGPLVVLGLVAASCSSDATKKQTPPDYSAAGEGGESDGGGTDAGSSGTGMNGGDAGAPGEGGATPVGGDGGDGGASAGSGGTTSTAMTDGYLSGTRLRAALDVAAGAQRFVGWHDTMLDIDCAFQVDSAGVERCLPAFSQGSGSFSDVDCKVQIVSYDAGVAPAKYEPDAAYVFACGTGAHWLTVGALTTATNFHHKEATGCVDDGPVPTGRTVYSLGAAAPDATFVAAAKTDTEARDARLTATVRVATDGSREVTSFYDLDRKTECNPLELKAGAWGCVPDARAYIEYFFADTGCTVPAAFHPGYAQQVCGFTPTIVQNTSPNFTSTYYEVGAKLETAVHDKNGAACPVYTPDASLVASFYSVGVAVPTSAFPPFSLTNEGTGRVQVQTLKNPEGGVMSRELFYDNTLAAACSPRAAADLVQRCLPATSYTNNLFSDIECKQALFASAVGTAPPADLVYIDSLQTNGGEAVFKLGAKTTTPAHTYELNGLDCVELGIVGTQDYYSTTIVAPSDLVAVTRKVE